MNREWHFERLTDTPSLLILGAIVMLLITEFIALRLRTMRSPYQPRDSLFSPAELRFLEVLESLVDKNIRIYAKVRLADIVTVNPRVSGRRFWRAFNPIACKHVDYVLCDRRDRRVLCVIELDDRSHQRLDRQQRDVFVDSVMRSARIPILHVAVAGRYSVAELRGRLGKVLREGRRR